MKKNQKRAMCTSKNLSYVGFTAFTNVNALSFKDLSVSFFSSI